MHSNSGKENESEDENQQQKKQVGRAKIMANSANQRAKTKTAGRAKQDGKTVFCKSRNALPTTKDTGLSEHVIRDANKGNAQKEQQVSEAPPVKKKRNIL